jgi:transposase
MVAPLIPEPRRREDRRGRPWKGKREILNGVLYVLRTGKAWAGLPDSYPPYQTCHRRFHQWVQSGVLGCVLRALDEVHADLGTRVQAPDGLSAEILEFSNRVDVASEIEPDGPDCDQHLETESPRVAAQRTETTPSLSSRSRDVEGLVPC